MYTLIKYFLYGGYNNILTFLLQGEEFDSRKLGLSLSSLEWRTSSKEHPKKSRPCIHTAKVSRIFKHNIG